MQMVDTDFVEVFEILPGIVVPNFRRGDVNDDGAADIADAISVLSHLFGDDPVPGCPDTADANDDGALDIADAIAILSYLFSDGTVPPPGADDCGPDPTDDTLATCVYENC